MLISAMVAMSENRVIGKNNTLPWHMPADLRHFKRITLGKPILMGRKTYESIGKALPDRINIVLTRDKTFQAPGCVIVNSVAEALHVAEGSEELVIIGGAVLFEKMLDKIQRWYLTIIHHRFDGDVMLPPINFDEWHEISREDHPANNENHYPYSFVVLSHPKASYLGR